MMYSTPTWDWDSYQNFRKSILFFTERVAPYGRCGDVTSVMPLTAFIITNNSCNKTFSSYAASFEVYTIHLSKKHDNDQKKYADLNNS